MNRSYVLSVLVGLFAVQSAALACPRSERQLICTQDTVVDSSNYVAKVIGINPSTQKAAIKREWNGAMVTVPVRSLALGMGCVGGVCVDDFVVDSSNYKARVLAVNPYTRSVAIKREWNGAVVTTGVDTVALGLGCVGNICVGNKIVDGANYKAKVLGVNQYTGQVAYQREWNDAVVTARAVDLALGNGCLNGVCIGDKVVDEANYNALVLGINYYENQVAIQRDWNGAIVTYPVDTLAITNYCQDYGDEYRARPVRVPRVTLVKVKVEFDFYVSRQ